MISKRAFLEGSAAVYREYLTAVILHGQAAADTTGLHATDLYTLNLLGVTGPLTAGRLAEQIGLTTGATTRLIDRLERGGYVERTRDAEDRRRVIVGVVPARAGELRQVFAPAQEQVGEILQGYTLDELRTLFDYFGRATTAYRQVTDRLRD